MLKTQELYQRRRIRARYKLKQMNKLNRLRLCVHRTNQHIYAQIIDDSKSNTLVCASTVGSNMLGSIKSGGNKEAAVFVGKLIAERALAQGIKQVVFDRSGYLFHGRIKALADSAKESGLEF